MNYLLKRQGRYYFNRRVPSELIEFDKRKFVRVALRTESHKEATGLAAVYNQRLEHYWKELVATGNKAEYTDYERALRYTNLLGFEFRPATQIASLHFEQVLARLSAIEGFLHQEQRVASILGGVSEPQLKIDDALHRYIEFVKGKTMNKSPDQFRKWLNPRKLAVKNFIECVGNKYFIKLTREDTLKYRDWWIGKVQNQGLKPHTANKNIIMVKTIIETVNDNLDLKLDTPHIFKKIILPDDDPNRRLPFETNYIVSTLLNQKNLAGLNEQAKWVLHAIAETGAGTSEQVGLLAEDIRLDCDIPHIIITPRMHKSLKTKYRKRVIPLVGFALDAFKACPQGFTDYHDRPDSLSGVLNKYLRENDLFPSDDHTVYSLRHSFQDRLLAASAPDRVQADLMGHKFNRPSYGDGASLRLKLDWLRKIQLKTEY